MHTPRLAKNTYQSLILSQLLNLKHILRSALHSSFWRLQQHSFQFLFFKKVHSCTIASDVQIRCLRVEKTVLLDT